MNAYPKDVRYWIRQPRWCFTQEKGEADPVTETNENHGKVMFPKIRGVDADATIKQHIKAAPARRGRRR